MVGDRQSPPIRSNNGVGLCTICLTGGFYSEFAGTFSANRCVPDTITKKCVDPTGSVMCNLYYADLWIMPTISSERALAAAIAALESA